MRSALFCDFTQRRMVVCYRRFGTTYRPHLQRSSLTLEDGTDRCFPTFLKLANHLHNFSIPRNPYQWKHLQARKKRLLVPQGDFSSIANWRKKFSQYCERYLEFFAIFRSFFYIYSTIFFAELWLGNTAAMCKGDKWKCRLSKSWLETGHVKCFLWIFNEYTTSVKVMYESHHLYIIFTGTSSELCYQITKLSTP